MAVPFVGSWRIDAQNSKLWDYSLKQYISDDVGEEIVRIGGDERVQEYEVLYGDRPVVRMGYSSRFDDPEWVPYTVRGVDGVAEADIDEELIKFEKRIQSPVPFRLGGVYGLVRSVYIDEQTHYRISKDPDTGKGGYVMLRRLADDGQSYVATLLRVDGVIARVRRFERIPD